ncbi:MAG TPA: hypothetical protein PLY89_09395, partial [Synergistaceae bacterium]|nr:hypothetical protein [Synergistaceae bacterium]
PQRREEMFLPLEENDLVHMGRVVALVRDDGETAVILRDGSVMATGFTPRTLARRHAELAQRLRTREACLAPPSGEDPLS